MTDKEFLASLVEARQAAGLTVSDVAFAMRMHWQRASSFEKGENSPSLEKVFAYAALVGKHVRIGSTSLQSEQDVIAWLRTFGESGHAISRATGQSVNNICCYLAGRKHMRLDTLLKVADYVSAPVTVE